MFPQVPKNVSFPGLEEEILKNWKENNVFQKSLELNSKSEAYSFYDGPPFATGLPHYGHLLAGTLKDVVPRYWTMKGKRVERRFGWDCHGLPVENEMEKKLEISGKTQLEEYGVPAFNEACRSIVLRYTSEWERTVERMGRWVDFKNDYKTMNPNYMESIWWVFKQLWDQDLIYRGHRIQPYCPRCSTTLSNFETNQGYQDRQDPSITVSFPIKGKENTFLLAWTTTPWTLPSNVALAAGPDIDYVEVDDNGSHYILAKDRLSAYYKKADECVIVATYKGKDLIGFEYEPLFDFFKDEHEGFFKVVNADYVSTEDGTGIVHIAPAFGEEDYNVGKENGWPLMCPVDDEGRFTDKIPQWKGMKVKDADKEIIRVIKAKGRLIHQSTLVHSYPHCYRCETPLIYMAMPTWFMNIEPIKEKLIKNNSSVRWVPDYIKEGRFGNWLANARDWNLARNRYWGNPLPIWECECSNKECIGSIEELDKLMGGKLVDSMKELAVEFEKKNPGEHLNKIKNGGVDLHKHFVDKLELKCPKCGKTMKRTPEVFDCWFESGSMPYAQGHYPFENKEAFDSGFPADFVAEGLDQTRGWFYTLIVLSTALFDKPAFKNVVVNGIILASDGKKMSKSLKNYPDPVLLINEYGADAIRLYMINSPAVRAENLKFSKDGVKDMVKSVILPLWNVYSFFTTYANIDNWNSNELVESENDLDRWIKYQLEMLVASVEKDMEQYHLYSVVPSVISFIDDLTNWYIRRSRRRFWKSENDNDKKSAYSTLYTVLVEYCKVLAPFLPFLSDYIYKNLTTSNSKEKESVHLCKYPNQIITEEKRVNDSDLWKRMNIVRKIVEMGRGLREEKEIKTRQPLPAITVVINKDMWKQIDLMADLIKDELNVKTVDFTESESDFVEFGAKPNFKLLGRRFGKKMPEVKKMIETFSEDKISTLQNGGKVETEYGFIESGDVEITRTPKEGILVKTNSIDNNAESIGVALKTDLTEELVKEGIAREFVHTIQNLRKEKDFNVSDRIYIDADVSDVIWDAILENKEYITSETLCNNLERKILSTGEEKEINGNGIRIFIKIAN